MTNLNQRFSVAAIQMVSSQDIQENLQIAGKRIAEAVQLGAQIILLPEFFALLTDDKSTKLAATEIFGHGVVQDFLSEQAKQWRVSIIGGTHAIQSENKSKPYSRCLIFDHHGKCISWYDKVHLFDVAVDDNTGQYRESDAVTAGTKLSEFSFLGIKCGVAVCYDIRFPEMFRKMAQKGTKVVFVPAAFTAVTGKAHWEVLLRARAIENQIFIVAAAQGGEHACGRHTWGHSCIVSPWGDIIAQSEAGETVISAELDFKQQSKMREDFPVLAHIKF